MKEDDKDANIWSIELLFITKEISVQRILFDPFRNLYQGNMKIQNLVIINNLILLARSPETTISNGRNITSF